MPFPFVLLPPFDAKSIRYLPYKRHVSLQPNTIALKYLSLKSHKIAPNNTSYLKSQIAVREPNRLFRVQTNALPGVYGIIGNHEVSSGIVIVFP